MAIVKMKKLRLAALGSQQSDLMYELQRLGCVELRPCEAPEGYLSPDSGGDRDKRIGELQEQKRRAEAALKLLKQYAYEKTGLFPARDRIPEADFFADIRDEAQRACGSILEAAATLDQLQGEIYAQRSLADSLALWEPLGLPLEMTETRRTRIRLGSIPLSRGTEALEAALAEAGGEIGVVPAGSDRDRAGVMVVYARELESAVEPVLRAFSFERAPTGGRTGSAGENIAAARRAEENARRDMDEARAYLKECGQYRRLIRLYSDRLTLELDAAAADGALLHTSAAFALTGWVDEPSVPALEELLGKYCCAWELSDPEENDTVPIKLRNNALTEPLNMVTEMYSLPDYRNVDPNPLIAPFFCIFFGMMFNDLGYGLVFIILSLIVQKKFRLTGGTKNMIRLVLECGVTTAIFGIITGSFFGDAIPVVAKLLGKEVTIPSLLNPLADPMTVLILSLVLGVIQILFGMGVKAYILIRDGKPLDALFDVGSWWLLFAGIAVGALRGFWWIAIAGIAALVLTQGRAKPTIPGKIVGGIASLYDITSYFSDILSYSRLMALMLAGGIVASIVNVLGSLFGSVILFIPIFVIGHVFNIGINVIGTYVHAARLQYLEFFGKFYVDGGKPFRPLDRKTKYFEIIKEESIHG